jgi:hypothetical protein
MPPLIHTDRTPFLRNAGMATGILGVHFKIYLRAGGRERAPGAEASAVNTVFRRAPATGVRGQDLPEVATAFYSSGGGRYIANTNLPDLIVNHDASMTLVTTWSSLVGTEIRAGSKTSLHSSYIAAHANRAVTTDVDGSAIGFGVPGSTAANERIAEATAGLIHTFSRDPTIGGMQFIAQYSYVRSTPFSVPAGTPADASVKMIYLNVRYFLP